MTLTSEQIEILKKAAMAVMPPDEFARLQGEMEVLHGQVVGALMPELVRIVLAAQIALFQGQPSAEVLMQMYTSGFALGLVFAGTQELERLGRL